MSGVMHFANRDELDAYIREDARQRIASLARHIISMPTLNKRREFLKNWRKIHGSYSANSLEAKIKEVWAERSAS